MKTPSPYPVLDNRPIDQWKVTELKEELRKRKLPIKGLKDDLVRRLDEALRDELDSVKEDDVDNGLHVTPQTVGHADDVKALADTPQPLAQTEADSVLDGTPEPVVEADGGGKRYEKPDSTMTHFNNAESKGTSGCDSGINEESVVLVTSVETNIVETTVTVNKGVTHEVATDVLPAEAEVQDEEEIGGLDLVTKEEALVHVTSVDTSVTVNETVTHEAAMDVKKSPKDDFQSVGYDSNTQLEGQESGPPQDAEINSSAPGNQIYEVSTDVAFQVGQPEAEVAKPPQDAVKLNSSVPSNQVSEVSTVLGFQVKSDSISSDCVSINEKNELKDNIIDDNVKLELDVKPEMVHPSSSNVISDGSEPHPMDVEEPRDKKEPVDEGDEKNANLEINKKNDSIDVGSSEKLNLDRSSGDDSMDDDTIENKPIDSKYNAEGVVDEGEKTEESVMEVVPVVMSDGIPADKKHLVDEKKNLTAAPIMKRKHNDQVVGNNEISKRQRRWNTGTVKVPEPQSNTASSITPKDTFSPTTLKRNFSRSDSTASEETPKERVVPPSPKSPTTSLKIDRFLRPFTLKAVHELLGKTGSVTSFWMDHIKTHCYVTYSSVEEAIETRNAVYNLQWPPNGGRFLLAEFVDPQEVKTRTEAPPPSPATPVGTMLPPPPPTSQPPRQQVQRQQPLPPPPSLPLPPPPPLSNPPQARERLPPPPPVEKIDTPIVTLDDLFRKTKATPRIYYLPLTDEQIAAKRRNTKQ